MWPPRIRSHIAALVATLTALLLPLLAVLHLGRRPARPIALMTVEAVRAPPEPTPVLSPSAKGLGAPSPSPAERRQVVSTAYCETGKMANGERTWFGAVAMAAPMGSRWRILTGPLAGVVMTVADRYGAHTQFDIAMPGRCADARLYGRQRIAIEPA